MSGYNVECGLRGVVPVEIAGPGFNRSLHESPRTHTRRGSRDETPLSRRSLGRHLPDFLQAGGGCEVLTIGSRVVLREPRTAADLVCAWTVAECACDQCAAGSVALNEWTGQGWLHLRRSALRLQGQPSTQEFAAP